jgi:TolA-binding protein
MRLKRFLPLLAVFLLFPSGSTGASKEMQELQRDIAQLQDQVRTLQSALDQKMATLQTLTQQALETSNKANTGVSVLSAGVTSTMERELRTALTPVAGLAAKVDNTNNDVAELRNQMSDVNAQLRRMASVLDGISNNIKVMQAAAVAPPPPAQGQMAPPPADPKVVFDNAYRDQSGGKLDPAIQEYQDFIRFFPDDSNAVKAQFNIGEIHYSQQKFDLAADDFDTVITKYPDDIATIPQAYFMKGMALLGTNRTAAIATWRKLVNNPAYAKTAEAAKAKEQLRALNAPLTAPSGAGRKSKTGH